MDHQRPARREFMRWLDDACAVCLSLLARRRRSGELERRILLGRTVAEISLEHGARHGLARSMRWDGSLREEAHWRQGVRHGPLRAWRRGDRLAEECSYVDGRLEGRARGWYPDGSKRWIGHFSAGKRHGEWFYFHRDGRLDSKRTGVYDGGLRWSAIKGFNDWNP